MKLTQRGQLLCLVMLALSLLAFIGCEAKKEETKTATGETATKTATPEKQELKVVDRPQSVKDKMAQRGEQDKAAPVLKVVSPADNSTITGSTVNVKLALSGDLKGYHPHKDEDGTGNHIHVILDNQPYEAYYNLDQPFELRNLAEGKHTLRVFASRPWHESYKNNGAFQMVTFTVKGGGDATKPTTTATGEKVADAKKPAASPAAPKEGKDVAPSQAGAVDPKKPLLTYSRPKGEYKDKAADAIMVDFWLMNAKLQGDGGEYRVRWSVDGSTPQYIDKWEPVWLSGWVAGKHKVKVELVDKSGNVVDNGGYNATEREISVVK
ncbi:MAG: hypothetical protein U0Z53_11010 [Blastocatellia bacterium]